MAEVKWIKIKVDIFSDEKMSTIETLPDGYLIELIWFKILCMAGKCNNNGFLMVADKFPYTIEMLSKIFRMEVGVVQRALSIFQSLEMIDVVDNIFYVTNWDKNQSTNRLDELREKDKIRQREYRAKKKQQLLDINDDKKEEKNKGCHSDSHSDSHGTVTSDNALYSYIFNSNKSNIYNFNILLNNKDYIYIKENDKLLKSIKEFMEYKDNKKPKSSNHYGTELGMKKLLNKIIQNCKLYGIENVISVIDETIINNWQGIVWDKLYNDKERLDSNNNYGGTSNGCTIGNDADKTVDEVEEAYYRAFFGK